MSSGKRAEARNRALDGIDAGESARAAPEPASAGAALVDAGPSPARTPSVTEVLNLQRTAGNRVVSTLMAGHNASTSVLARRGWLDAIGDALDVRADEERRDAEEELETFRDTALTPLADHKPSSGLGQFDVAGDMRAGTMTVTLKVAYKFIDGTPANVVAGFRPEEFKWTSAEVAAWKVRYQADVSMLWSARFPMKSTKKHWDKMVVDTTVQVVEDAADPHFTLEVAKYPPDAGMVQSSICPPGTHHDAAGKLCPANVAGDTTGTAKLDSNDMRPEQKLDWGNAVVAIPFDEGSAVLKAAGTAALAPVITSVKGNPAAHVQLTGRASKTHKAGATPATGAIDNMDLARMRTAAVKTALLAGGVTSEQILERNAGEAGATTGREWCRVDAQVGTNQTQNPALHETGHMLGSSDEYPQTGAPAGSAVAAGYDAMIKAQTGDVVTRARNSDAMSVGSTVRRWNYAAFLEALKALTGKDEWTL